MWKGRSIKCNAYRKGGADAKQEKDEFFEKNFEVSEAKAFSEKKMQRGKVKLEKNCQEKKLKWNTEAKWGKFLEKRALLKEVMKWSLNFEQEFRMCIMLHV